MNKSVFGGWHIKLSGVAGKSRCPHTFGHVFNQMVVKLWVFSSSLYTLFARTPHPQANTFIINASRARNCRAITKISAQTHAHPRAHRHTPLKEYADNVWFSLSNAPREHTHMHTHLHELISTSSSCIPAESAENRKSDLKPARTKNLRSIRQSESLVIDWYATYRLTD